MKIRINIAAALAVSVLVSYSAGAWADDDDRREGKLDFAPVSLPKYSDECGSCHMAYPAGALPERSWRKLMSQLDDHFGENAELDEVDRQEITDYLVKHAAEHSHYRRAAKMRRSIASGETPLRISEVPYFVKEHRKVVRRISGSDKVKSISQCDSCHTRADSGSYAEREIEVPGIGRWED